jgi:hypothetical protein
LKQLVDATTNKKADDEQASYIFGFKSYLYTHDLDDLLCFPAAAFKLKKRPEQKEFTQDVTIKYEMFLALDNNQAFSAWAEYLCTRMRQSKKEGMEITISAKSMESYNTAIVNDMKRSKLQPTVSYYDARKTLMKRFSTQEAKYRTTGVIKAQVGSDVVPLDLHDLLCERLAQETEPKLAKLHLVMLLAFADVV